MQLNLKAFFEKIGAYYIIEMQNAIRKQTGIDGQPFSKVTESTARSRVYANNSARVKFKGIKGIQYPAKKSFKAGKKNSVTTKDYRRLLFTGKFWRNAFKFQSYGESVKIFINESYYGLLRGRGNATFQDIVAYNNRGSARLNPDVSNPPLIFPNNLQELAAMKSTKDAVRDWNSKVTQNEILDQMTIGMAKKTVVEMQF